MNAADYRLQALNNQIHALGNKYVAPRYAQKVKTPLDYCCPGLVSTLAPIGVKDAFLTQFAPGTGYQVVNHRDGRVTVTYQPKYHYRVNTHYGASQMERDRLARQHAEGF